LLTGMMTVFFYARMWRRSAVLTDLEFYEMRYSGKAASFVRGFRSIYLGLFFNCVIMATVNLAAAKIASIVLGWPAWQTLVVASVITVFFASVSGLWGVLVTDSIQFTITMTGTIAVSYFALQQPAVGGLAGLLHKIDPKVLNLLPDFGDWHAALLVFIIPITVQWWSVWYPGAEPGGGSYIAQRMLAAKSERDALTGTLFFNAMHYALRPWPWIITALASTLVFPQLADIARAFPHVEPRLIGNDTAYPAMFLFLPAGFLGLVVAGTLAAYRSTIETHLNWGTSYLVHDFYRRFLNKGKDEKHYVLVGRITTALLMVAAASLSLALSTAKEAFDLILSLGAGTGLIYLLRWFWWRINAWSEIAVMASAPAFAVGFFLAGKAGHPVEIYWSLPVTVLGTTLIWLAVTYFTKPTDQAQLVAFYRKVRPAGPGWRAIRAAAGGEGSPDRLSLALLGWTLGCVLIYSALFGFGSFLYGRTAQALTFAVLFGVSALGLTRVLPLVWGSREGAS
ncbi:MAG TPA: sodium:solute symporter family protein, partial [Gemmatimonadales bacterium]|nr:sodium:solute symporter family protein [Gemmatimonadales bacterium]